MTDNPLVRLHSSIDREYGRDELRDLCLGLRLDYDSLRGEGKTARARELLLYLGRHQRFEELLNRLRDPLPEPFDPAALYAALPAFEARRQEYAPAPPPEPDRLAAVGTLPPGSRLPFHRNAHFTGRETVLLDLARALLHSKARATRLGRALAGPGGIGKTQLAVEFAYRYGRFFRGVHWVNAKDPGAIATEVAACGAAMGLPDWSEELPQQVARTLDAWREDGPRLVILDDLEDIPAARRWLPWLSDRPIRLLLTARQAEWPYDLGLGSLWLAPFEPQESASFLRCHLPPANADGEELQALAERLGHLPLALELAGRYLKGRPRFTVHAYLERLESLLADPALENWRPEWGNPTGYGVHLRAAFRMSWEGLRYEAARQIFLAAGYCAPHQPIPCELLQRAAGLEPEACDEALGTLVGLGLMCWQAGEPGPSIHPLMGEYALAENGAAEALPGLADALRTLTFQALKTGLPDAFRPLLPHASAVAALADRAGLETAATLWNNLGSHLWMVADYDGARDYLERALAIFENVLGPEHPQTATSLDNLGGLLHNQGHLDRARVYYERALAIWEQAPAPEHPNTAGSLDKLAALLQDLGDLEGARRYRERALAFREKVLGPDHPDTAKNLNDLGALLKAQGQLDRARDCYARALSIQEQVLGPEHPDTAGSLNNLGGLLHEQGQLEGARDYYQRALLIKEKVLWPDDPSIATSLNNLGDLLQDLGDLAGARGYHQRALTIFESVLGPEHPHTATSLNNLGSVLQDRGDLEGARHYYQRALTIFEKALGPEHPDTAATLNNLGALLQELGHLDAAQAYYERALAIREKILSPEHPLIASSLNNLGGLLYAQGDLDRARDYFERALAIREKVLGPEHPDTQLVTRNLAALKRRQAP